MCKEWQVCEEGAEGDFDEAQLEAVLNSTQESAVNIMSFNVCITLRLFEHMYSVAAFAPQLEVGTAVEAVVGTYSFVTRLCFGWSRLGRNICSSFLSIVLMLLGKSF